MKITIEVDEKVVEQNVTDLVCHQLASQLYKELGGRGDSLSYRYHVEIREIIRKVMKENYDALAKEAVSAAAKSIEDKAMKETLKGKIMAVLEDE